MAVHLLRASSTDPGMLSTVLLASCRSLNYIIGSDVYAQGLMIYKGQTLESLNTAISVEGNDISDASIAKALALATDAVSPAAPRL